MARSQRNTIDAYLKTGDTIDRAFPSKIAIGIDVVNGIRDYEKKTAIIAEQNREKLRRENAG